MGGILYVNGQIVVFIFGMLINKEIFGVYVEKVDISIDGVYVMINYEFVNYIFE